MDLASALQDVVILTLGIGGGGWATAHFLEVSMLRVAAHPSVRKLANAADRMSEGGITTTWPGVVGKLVDVGAGMMGIKQK